MRHYEVVYLIHEDHKDEVENVNTKVQGDSLEILLVFLIGFLY